MGWSRAVESILEDAKVMVIRSTTPASRTQSKAAPSVDTYVAGDAIPVPDVIEKDSDSVWALWSDAVQSSADADAATQPATLLMGLPELPKERDR